jgi:hypothetical protein
MEENNVPVSRIWLENLSNNELIELADSFGIDIPHGLERIFIIEEILLESASMSEPKPEDDIKINPSYSETAALPKQYNISYIEVVIRDPLWIFVFWEIKGHDREIHENAEDFKGYFLRAVPLNEEGTKSNEFIFTVPVDAEDSARYLGFAEHSSQTHGRYVVKLGVTRGDSEIQIAASQPFCLPKLIENKCINEKKENPLVRLSGVQDLSIITSTDRQARVKRP